MTTYPWSTPKDPNATYTTCPRCGEEKLRTDRPAMNALSRTDNETYVCSDCGTSEGLEDFVFFNGDQKGPSPRSKENWKAPQAATYKMKSPL